MPDNSPPNPLPSFWARPPDSSHIHVTGCDMSIRYMFTLYIVCLHYHTVKISYNNTGSESLSFTMPHYLLTYTVLCKIGGLSRTDPKRGFFIVIKWLWRVNVIYGFVWFVSLKWKVSCSNLMWREICRWLHIRHFSPSGISIFVVTSLVIFRLYNFLGYHAIYRFYPISQWWRIS